VETITKGCEILIGVILAGGHGKRLHPATISTNKHLVPVSSLPMIEYPIFTLARAGIKDIVIVTGGDHFDAIARYLGNGHERGLNFHYAVQNRPFEHAKGIAHAISVTKQIVGNQDMAIVLGDNIISKPLDLTIPEGSEAKIFLKEVPDEDFLFPNTKQSRFGVPYFYENKIVEIKEKPENPPNNYCIIGVYLYKASVFDILPTLTPSARGELEVSDLNDHFVKKGTLSYGTCSGFWSDAGTWRSHDRASEFVKRSKLDKEVMDRFPILKEWETWNQSFEK
jgi:glucose-1-phosphate thymidylyltransferase